MALFAIVSGGSLYVGCKSDESRPRVIDFPSSPRPGLGSLPPDSGGMLSDGGAVLFADLRSRPRALADSSIGLLALVSRVSVDSSEGGVSSTDAGNLGGSGELVAVGGGGGISVVASGFEDPHALLVVGTLAYVLDRTFSGEAVLYRIDLAGGGNSALTPLVRAIATPALLASDGQNLYVASSAGGISVERLPLSATAPVEPVNVTAVPGQLTVAAIALRGPSILFAAASATGGALYQAPVAGGPAENVVILDPAVPVSMSLSAQRTFVVATTALLEIEGQRAAVRGSLSLGSGVAVTAAGAFVSDARAGAVLLAPPDGGDLRVVAAGLSAPGALLTGRDGRLYVSTDRGVERL